MIHSDIVSYSNYLLQNPKVNHFGCDIDYISRLKRLINVIKDVGNTIEYGTTLKTPKLNTNDQLCIYNNIKPYFYPTDLPARAQYSDVSLLVSRGNPNSIVSFLPPEIVHHILSLKNQLGFMSYPALSKHYSK